MIRPDDRKLLTDMFDAAVKAADPLEAMKPYLPDVPKGRTIVIGAGKGAAQMAAAFETLWTAPLEGVVVTRYGYAAPTKTVRVLEASHPVPDEAGLSAAAELEDAVSGLTADDLVLKDVFVTEDDLLMPRGIFIKTMPHWPHMMATLSPTYMGVAQSAYDFTVQYLRGETPGLPPIDRRQFTTKRLAVGQMYQRLAGIRALWWQAFMEAQGFPTKAQVMRIYAAQYNVMEGAQELAALAIRTCGGQSMLKSLPLERIYRDSRCGALMLPYTSEIMEDYMSVLALYDLDELDGAPSDEHGARTSLWRGDGGEQPLAAE